MGHFEGILGQPEDMSRKDYRQNKFIKDLDLKIKKALSNPLSAMNK